VASRGFFLVSVQVQFLMMSPDVLQGLKHNGKVRGGGLFLWTQGSGATELGAGALAGVGAGAGAGAGQRLHLLLFWASLWSACDRNLLSLPPSLPLSPPPLSPPHLSCLLPLLLCRACSRRPSRSPMCMGCSSSRLTTSALGYTTIALAKQVRAPMPGVHHHRACQAGEGPTPLWCTHTLVCHLGQQWRWPSR